MRPRKHPLVKVLVSPLYTNGDTFSFRTESDYEVKFNKHIVLPSFLYLFLLQFGEINLDLPRIIAYKSPL